MKGICKKILEIVSVVFFIIVSIGLVFFALSDIEYIKIVAITCGAPLAFLLFIYGFTNVTELIFDWIFDRKPKS